MSYPLNPIRRRLLAGTAMLCVGRLAYANSQWPHGKPITWVVPYPAGGSTDVLGRALAQQLDGLLATRVIVENRPGATGTIGAARVVRAEPDGLTLLGTSIGPQAIAPHVMDSLTYDPVEDLAPVITIGTIPHLLVVSARQPWRSVAALVDAAKSATNGLSYASGGMGTILHMQGQWLARQSGAPLLHVPYKGDTPALQDTLGGQVHFMFAPIAAALPHIQSGTLRVLAATSAQRLPALPDTPTMVEAGYRDFVAEQWQAVFAPAGTPADIITRVNRAIGQALRTPELAALTDKLGITVAGGSPQDLDMLRRTDYEKWGKLIREAQLSR